MPKKSTTDHHTRASRASLAAYLRARWPKELMDEFYATGLMGEEPILIPLDDPKKRALICRRIGLDPEVRDYIRSLPDECEHSECVANEAEGGFRCNRAFVGEHTNRVTPDHKNTIVARIHDRAYGQAPQHHVVEAEMKATVTAIAGVIDPKMLRTFSKEDLMAMARIVGKNVQAPALPDPAPIEVPFREAVPELLPVPEPDAEDE